MNVKPMSGKGHSVPTSKVRNVETLPCPGRDGPHWLTNQGGVTLCRGCRVSWAELDAAMRGAL